MTEINPGDVRRVSGSFTNPAGVATDPTTITVRWRHHRGTETAWVYGTDTQVVKDSVGAYHADIPITVSGLYYYKFEGTGAVQAAEEGTFLAETFFESVAPSTPSGPIRLYTGTADPTTGAGVPAAIGSVYSRTLLGSESVWVKTGAADTGWVQSGSAGGGTGSASDVLTDPGNDWAPSTVVTVGYRIAETVNGALRVFETTTSGMTHATATGFTDFAVSLVPLGITNELVTWRYLGIVGELPWDIVPLPGIGLDDQGFHVDALSSISDAETMFQLLPALGDPGNAWEAATLISTANYRIAATVSGALRVFEMVTLGTTGGSEPTWQIGLIGQTTPDGSASWAYRGTVGQPDTDRPVFVANTAGDADWYLDINNGSGIRFQVADNGVALDSTRLTEITIDGFKVAVAGAQFYVQYDPFAVFIDGLPTADPGVSTQLWNDAGHMAISAG
jgi:hypothetical protein